MDETKFYFTSEQAVRDLPKREYLKAVVEEWWRKETGCDLSQLFGDGQKAFLARQIASFRYEDGVFVILVQRAGLQPHWLEYSGDKFSEESSLKRSYLRPQFCFGRGRKGGLKCGPALVLADFNQWRGKPLNTIVTLKGQSLVDWHHEYQKKMWPEAINLDFTPWLVSLGSPTKYYPLFLALAVAHGVLFENFHSGESGPKLNAFATRIFESAWQEVIYRFGFDARPLIVPLPWQPEFALYPGDSNWREHSIIPSGI